MSSLNKNLRRYWLTAGLAHAAFTVASPLQAQVLWEEETQSQTQQAEILVPISSSSNDERLLSDPIFWEPLQSNKTQIEEKKDVIVWESVPSSKYSTNGSELNTTVVWEMIPDSNTATALTNTKNMIKTNDKSLHSKEELAPTDADIKEVIKSARKTPNKQRAHIQALNRSVAFSDGMVGPDIGWLVPNGFRWSERWFADTTIESKSLHDDDGASSDSNNGHLMPTIHTNLLQTKNWSVGLNTSFSNTNQRSNTDTRPSKIGEGISSGFRIARAINETAGIAFGGEHILQWDDKTTKGRNFYRLDLKGGGLRTMATVTRYSFPTEESRRKFCQSRH